MKDSAATGDEVRFEQVFADELSDIKKRWTNVYEDGTGGRPATSDHPTTKNDLFGLAFSGGGIRSATIHMGIAQALYERGVFDHADYMSTVSGGGYLGASISTAMRSRPDDPSKFPPGKGEFPYAVDFPTSPAAESTDGDRSPFLTWVRNNSNYLVTGGFLDVARLVGVLLRGILVNFLILVPILLLLAMALTFRYGDELRTWNALDARTAASEAQTAAAEAVELQVASGEPQGQAARDGAAALVAKRTALEAQAKAEEARQAAEAAVLLVEGPLPSEAPTIGSFYRFVPHAVGLFLFLSLVFPVLIRVYKIYRARAVNDAEEESAVSDRSLVELTFARSLVLIGIVVAIETLPILMHYFHRLHDSNLRDVMAGAASGGALVAISMAGKVLSRLGGLRQKLVLAAVGLLGMAIPLVVILYVSEGLVYGEWGDLNALGLSWTFWKDLAAAPLWLVPAVLLVILGGGAGAALVGRLWKGRQSVSRIFVSTVAMVVGAGAGYVLTVLLTRLLASLWGAGGVIPPAAFVLTCAAVISFFCWLAVDVNLTAVLGLYRDRLASAYLVGIRNKPGTEEVEVFVEPDLNLEDMCGHRSKAPYHLVNTTLNLQGSPDPMLRDRKSDFFMFSKNYLGGRRTGYCKTGDLEKVFPQMDLPTAMGISAAAASPNSGKITNKPLVALLTLFNIRLGYWVPHPGRLHRWIQKAAGPDGAGFKPNLFQRFLWRIRPILFLREMRSAVSDRDKWVNLSDGGHIENLGVYELLRRRCRYIISGDCGADPAMNFGALAELMRFARIDMGIEIEILLDDLRLGEDHLSPQHAALGRIKYPGETEDGYLLYIKSSFSGNEDETMQEYRAKNPTFPHESTADQFFDEGQFEAYRALGYHMAESLFPPRMKTKKLRTCDSWTEFTHWFDSLRANLAPRLSAKRSELQEQLRRIQLLLQQPEYHDYFYELNPQPGGNPTAEGKVAGFPQESYIVGQQLALMENAFISLHLDQPMNWSHEGNQGWRRLFEHWAESETFRRGYKDGIHLHSGRFQNFCENFLGLPPVDEMPQRASAG